MNIKCGNCGKEIVVPDDIVVGQHVRCPYCDEKMAFDKPSRVVLPTAVRPILQRVRPSGRGMQSEHELAAKRAAVASVERRFEHNERVRKSASRRRALANFGSIAVGLAVVAGFAYYFMCRSGIGVPSMGVGLGGIQETVREALPMAGALTDKVASGFRGRHADIVAEFAKGELTHWKDAPKELKPNNAPPGTVYHALVPKSGKFDLYELKASGAVTELPSSGKSVRLTMEDFKKACGGRPYYIACAGRVFVCGGGDLKMMDELRKALLPR